MGLQLEVVKPSSFGASVAWGRRWVQHLSSQLGWRWPSPVGRIRDTGNRVRPGTCLVWVAFGLTGTPSNKNASENAYNRGVRDAGWSADDSGRDGPGSVELQRAFVAASRFDAGPPSQ